MQYPQNTRWLFILVLLLYSAALCMRYKQSSSPSTGSGSARLSTAYEAWY